MYIAGLVNVVLGMLVGYCFYLLKTKKELGMAITQAFKHQTMSGRFKIESACLADLYEPFSMDQINDMHDISDIEQNHVVCNISRILCTITKGHATCQIKLDFVGHDKNGGELALHCPHALKKVYFRYDSKDGRMRIYRVVNVPRNL